MDIPGVEGSLRVDYAEFPEGSQLFKPSVFRLRQEKENPLFMSASRPGYRQFLALDAFVEGAGEGPACGLRQDNDLAADRLSDLSQDVENKNGALNPPALELPEQLRVTLARWRAGGRPVLAIITHDVGGGTERQVLRICEDVANTHHVLIVRPGDGHDSIIRVENPGTCDGFYFLIDILDGEGFARFLRMSGVDTIQLHHLYNHGTFIRDGLAQSGIPFNFHVHDYYVICPQITLTTPTENYCGEPVRSICDVCIAGRPAFGSTDIRNWRDAHEWAVLNADSIVTPSHDAAIRLRNYFDVNPVVVYHEPYPVIAAASIRSEPVNAGNPLRVVLLGVLSLIKGRAKVFEAATVAKAQGLPMVFHLIGHTENEPLPDTAGGFTMTGEYLEDDLPELLAKARPDMFLFASAAPETYAFTLTAAMRTGHPILATDLGAFSERLAGYSHARLYPHMLTGEELAARILSFAQEHLPEAFS